MLYSNLILFLNVNILYVTLQEYITTFFMFFIIVVGSNYYKKKQKYKKKEKNLQM